MAKECDDCGEVKEVHQLHDDYALSWSISFLICKDCYSKIPEPDTGMPDWEDLSVG